MELELPQRPAAQGSTISALGLGNLGRGRGKVLYVAYHDFTPAAKRASTSRYNFERTARAVCVRVKMAGKTAGDSLLQGSKSRKLSFPLCTISRYNVGHISRFIVYLQVYRYSGNYPIQEHSN